MSATQSLCGVCLHYMQGGPSGYPCSCGARVEERATIREIEVVRCYRDGHWDRVRATIPMHADASAWRDNAPNVMHWAVVSDSATPAPSATEPS